MPAWLTMLTKDKKYEPADGTRLADQHSLTQRKDYTGQI